MIALRSDAQLPENSQTYAAGIDTNNNNNSVPNVQALNSLASHGLLSEGTLSRIIYHRHNGARGEERGTQ